MDAWKFIFSSLTVFKFITSSSKVVEKMNIFLPPDSVRGMTSLDREMFKKKINVSIFEVDVELVKPISEILKQYSLKMPNFKNVQFLDSDKTVHSEKRKIILNPTIITSFQDIKERDREKLLKFGIDKSKFKISELNITYENWKADEILKAILPADKESAASYSIIGHIVHLNLREHLLKYKYLIGQVLLDKIKLAKTVVNKLDTIDTAYRFFKMEILCGEDNMITEARENGCVYKFDFSSVYWNPRLSTEHERITNKLKFGDILYDVFAGVGPFAIPAAKKKCKVLANDLNPESFKWLQYNIKLNKVNNLITVFNKDGADFIKDDIKYNLLQIQNEVKNGDGSIHITMNLPALAVTFLSAFRNLYTIDEMKSLKTFPFVHVYCFIKGEGDTKRMAKELVEKEIGLELKDNLDEIYFVRNVAPNKYMIRVSFLLNEDILTIRDKRKGEEVDRFNETKRNCLKACGKIN